VLHYFKFEKLARATQNGRLEVARSVNNGLRRGIGKAAGNGPDMRPGFERERSRAYPLSMESKAGS